MSNVKKGLLTASGEWRKHLRDLKRAFWKGERQAAGEAGIRGACEADVVWRAEKPDAVDWVEVSVRPDGLAMFTAFTGQTIIDPVFGDHQHSWPLIESGLYPSAYAARTAARQQIDWLKPGPLK